MKLTFLGAAVALTKTITKQGIKAYPLIKNFTSYQEVAPCITDFHRLIVKHAAEGHCLIKGQLAKALSNESRKGQHTDKHTQYVCFDLDKAPFSSPDEFMRAIKQDNTSYVVQYSSSYKLTKKPHLSCHIFVMLDAVMSPNNLKCWLMHLNLNTPALEKGITLSESLEALHWSLDITTCQNDKLIYIAPPRFIDVPDPVKNPSERIQLVIKESPNLKTPSIELHPIASLKAKAKEKINNLRTAMGLKPQNHKLKMVEDFEIQPNASEVGQYEIVEEGEDFTRLNIGGGDSQAYWFFNSDFELLRNFKGEPFTYMKDTLPELYKKLKGEVRKENLTPSDTGDVVIAFREKQTGQYWKGLYNGGTNTLEVYSIDSKDKLHDFLQGHGIVPPPYIPEWQTKFDPTDETVVDPDNRILNFYVEPPLLKIKQGAKSSYPIIQHCIDSAVGKGPIQEHFLNWLAVIAQYKKKACTAWVLHGTQGTGKGILFHNILTPIFTKNYCNHVLASALNSDFNGWQENKLLCFIDEIEVSMFEKKSVVEAQLKLMIDAPEDQIHRKGVNRYTVPSFVNLIFGSNKPQPIQIPGNDRRYNVGQYQAIRWLPTEHEVEVGIGKELPAFAHYLMTRKANIKKAREILHTEDRDEMQILNLTASEECAHHILIGDLEYLIDQMQDETLASDQGLANMYNSLMRSIVVEQRDRLTRDELGLIFRHCCNYKDEGPNKLSSYLRHRGIKCKDLRYEGLLVKALKVKWKQPSSEVLSKFKSKTPLLRKVK